MDNDKPNNISVQCKHCGGKIDIDISKEIAECPYCGNSISVNEIISESDAVRIEKIKSQTYKDVEKGKLELEKEKSKKNEDKEKLQAFKNGKFSKVLIVFSVLSLFLFCVAFHYNRVLAGIISLAMFILFMGSWAMGSQIIREPRRGIHILTAVVAFLLIIPYFNCSNVSSSAKAEKFDWSSVELGNLLPEPKSNVGVIHYDSEDSLSIGVYKTSADDYKKYVSDCEDFGYTVDSDKSEHSYSGYNEDGYELSLSYYESSQEMSVDLDAPIEMSEFQWPKSELAQLVPVPESTQGSITWEYSDEFLIEVGNTTIDDFKDYVDECYDSGFNVDYQKGDDYYYADDSSGNHISLRYEGNNIMSVQASAPDEDETNETTTEKITETTTAELSTEESTQTIVTEAVNVDETQAVIETEAVTEQTVYITNTGKRYHRKSCRTLKGNEFAVSLSEAVGLGLTPCQVCNP